MTGELAEHCKDRWREILMRLALLDAKALAGKDVPCPICRAGHDRFRFSDKGFGRWFCRGCGYGGDGVKLVVSIKHVGFTEAARLIEGVVGKCRTCNAVKIEDKPRDPLRSWREAYPAILGTAADVYLRGRGLTLTESEAPSVRFHPALWHWPTKTKWPCMVAPVGPAGGGPVTCHQTFLELDGSGKAPVERPRLFHAGVAPIGGVWFGEADPANEFVVAEGIESLLSAMRICGVSGGCAAFERQRDPFSDFAPGGALGVDLRRQ
jgi:putative DNA primase/helicase